MANMNGVGGPVLSETQDGTIVDFGNGNLALLSGVSIASLFPDSVVTGHYHDPASFYQVSAPIALLDQIT
jgi:hypothetical protein